MPFQIKIKLAVFVTILMTLVGTEMLSYFDTKK